MSVVELRARDEAIAALRRGGRSVKDIAPQFGLTESAVSYVCRKLGAVPPRDRFRCGHPRTIENSVMGSDGRERCLICKRRAAREYMQRIAPKITGTSIKETPCALAEIWK